MNERMTAVWKLCAGRVRGLGALKSQSTHPGSPPGDAVLVPIAQTRQARPRGAWAMGFPSVETGGLCCSPSPGREAAAQLPGPLLGAGRGRRSAEFTAGSVFLSFLDVNIQKKLGETLTIATPYLFSCLFIGVIRNRLFIRADVIFGGDSE